MDSRVALAGAALFSSTLVLRPLLVAQIAYAAVGVGIGFGATKFFRFVRSGDASAAIGSRLGVIWPRLQAKLRAFVLKIYPSLANELEEEPEGRSLSLRDLRGPPILPKMPKPQRPKSRTPPRPELG